LEGVGRKARHRYPHFQRVTEPILHLMQSLRFP
jgi:hypothetical protein